MNLRSTFKSTQKMTKQSNSKPAGHQKVGNLLKLQNITLRPDFWLKRFIHWTGHFKNMYSWKFNTKYYLMVGLKLRNDRSIVIHFLTSLISWLHHSTNVSALKSPSRHSNGSPFGAVLLSKNIVRKEQKWGRIGELFCKSKIWEFIGFCQ